MKQENDINNTPGAVAQERLVRCWSCGGNGVGSPAVLNTAHRDIPCDRCEGTGQCPEIMREWETLGASYKADRLNGGYSLREWAKKRGYSIMDVSRAERGLIDPRSLTANTSVSGPCPPSLDSTNKNQPSGG